MAELPEISYHPYFALIAHFDHAESIRLHRPETGGGESLLKIADQFSTDCGLLRAELVKAYARFGPAKTGRSESDEAARFERHLFRPLCYAALGHSDDLSIVLIDNLPLLVRMTAVNRAIENSDVAFCPQVKTFCPMVDTITPQQKAKLTSQVTCTGNEHWPFWDLNQLIDDGERFLPEAKPHVDWSNRESIPSKLQDTPLCVVSNFKLNTLLALGHASLLQQAVMETMASTIRQTCLAFLDESGAQVHPFAQPLVSAHDIQSLKCVLLESQSAEDLVLLVFCSNYAVAEILITSLRHLTIEDLLAKKHVAETLSDGRLDQLHLMIAQRGEQHHDENAPLKNIHTNHVFMTSYSTFAVAHHAMRAANSEEAGIHGVVEAHVSIKIKPGHERQVRNRLDKAHENVFGHGSAVNTPPPENLEEISLRIVPGLHDEILNLTPNLARPFQPGALVLTGDVFRFLYRFFSGQDADPMLKPGDETGFLKIATSLVVPIPRIERDAEGKVTQPDAEPIAQELPKGELQPWAGPHPKHGAQLFRELRQAVEKEQFGLIVGLELRNALRELGCPSSLQYSLVRLFEEFLACIDDPPRCVAVLDLYECFAALNRLIRDDWPTYFKDIEKTEGRLSRKRKQAWLFGDSLFRDFIDALQNSFTLRLQRAVPHHETRDTAFNFRGGVSKFLAAMDVPLKCSLGLFRRMFGLEPDQVNAPEFKHRFAGVTSVCIGEQTTAQFMCFSKRELRGIPADPRDFPIYLTTFNLDVLHLYRPDGIVDFLHEIAHLHFDTFILQPQHALQELFMPSEDEDEKKEYVRIRAEEVFAELLTHLFVFETDTELFSKFYALGFSEVQESVLVNESSPNAPPSTSTFDESLACGLTEAMYRAFLVADSITQLKELAQMPLADWPTEHPMYREQFDASALNAAWERFQLYINDYGPYYRHYRRLWHDKPVKNIWEHCEKYFRKLYSASKNAERMRCLWQNAVSVCQRFPTLLRTSKDSDELGLPPSDLKELSAAIDACLRDGRAFRRMQWSRPVSGASRFGGVDALLVVCKLAYHYIRDIYGHIRADKIIYVEPEEENQPRRYDQDYNAFLFHAGHVVLYCVDPRAREERLLKQIACFKTLWDISSQLRARRLLDMMKLIPEPKRP